MASSSRSVVLALLVCIDARPPRRAKSSVAMQNRGKWGWRRTTNGPDAADWLETKDATNSRGYLSVRRRGRRRRNRLPHCGKHLTVPRRSEIERLSALDARELNGPQRIATL